MLKITISTSNRVHMTSEIADDNISLSSVAEGFARLVQGLNSGYVCEVVSSTGEVLATSKAHACGGNRIACHGAGEIQMELTGWKLDLKMRSTITASYKQEKKMLEELTQAFNTFAIAAGIGSFTFSFKL
jgi:hypothetical protein